MKSLIDEICGLEQEQTTATEHIRTKVLKEGKKLRQLQDWQKEQQKKASLRGEQPETWKDYLSSIKVNRVDFPVYFQCQRYMRISKYPGAYEKGMSVQEAYKMATAWKKNGGNPPVTAKISIRQRIPNQVGNWVGKALNRLEDYNERDWKQASIDENWKEDDFIGCEQVLRLCRQEINQSLKKLNEVMESKGMTLEYSD